MVSKYLNFLPEYVLPKIAISPFFKRVTRFMNLHFSPRKDIMVNVGGKKMYASTLDRLFVLYLWKFSIMENFETKLIKEIVKMGMTVFDIGANIGYYTLVLAEKVGKTGKVYAFEPDNENYRLLVKNIKASSFNNVVAVKKAISDKIGKTKLFISEEHRGDHRLYDPRDKRKAVDVETISLDKFAQNKIKPDIIKMDIEGAEFRAILGMENLIKKKKDLAIICEFNPKCLKQAGIAPEKLLKKFQSYGFKIKYIDEKKQKVEEISILSLMKKCSGVKYVNLFLKR